MDQASNTTSDNMNAPLRRRSFRWRDDNYRLDSSVWQFWGGGRLLKLPGEPVMFRMTPDDASFLRFGSEAGFELDEAPDPSLPACQAVLEQNGYRVWTVREALDIVREDTDPAQPELLMDRLIYFYFLFMY